MSNKHIAYLEQLLQKAVSHEDYERAAVLRDQLIARKEEALAALRAKGYPQVEEVPAPTSTAPSPEATSPMEDGIRRTPLFMYHGRPYTQQELRALQTAGEAGRKAGEEVRRQIVEHYAKEFENALREQVAKYFGGLELDSYTTMRGDGFRYIDLRDGTEEYHFRGRLLLIVDFNHIPPVIIRM